MQLGLLPGPAKNLVPAMRKSALQKLMQCKTNCNAKVNLNHDVGPATAAAAADPTHKTNTLKGFKS